MPAINADNREAWQNIANNASKQRPDPGKRVRVTESRKHKGKEGTVARHMKSRYVDAFRYGNEASHHMREIAGRYGFIVKVQPDEGSAFWIDADKVEVL